MHTSSSDLADHGPVLGFVQAEAPDWGSYFRKAQRVVEGGQEDYRAAVEEHWLMGLVSKDENPQIHQLVHSFRSLKTAVELEPQQSPVAVVNLGSQPCLRQEDWYPDPAWKHKAEILTYFTMDA